MTHDEEESNDMNHSCLALVLAIPAMLLPATASAQSAPQPITRNSFTATLEAQFKAIDANKDYSATRAEIETYQRAQGQQLVQRQTDGLFAQLDANRDGSISRAEFSRLSSSTKVTPNAAPMLAQMDGNKDGKISVAEFRAAGNAGFAKRDTNRDNVISLDEMRAGQPKR